MKNTIRVLRIQRVFDQFHQPATLLRLIVLFNMCLCHLNVNIKEIRLVLVTQTSINQIEIISFVS